MPVPAPKILRQCGALPYTVTRDGKVKVLLVTSRGRRRWIIPKGWPMPKVTAADAAAREAYEEAGLVGQIVGAEPVGYYRYEKRRKPTVFEVSVFLFAVERQLRNWPERAERETRWFDIEEASDLVSPEGLGDVLEKALQLLTIEAE